MTSVHGLRQIIINDPSLCDQACSRSQQGFIFSHMITLALELVYGLLQVTGILFFLIFQFASSKISLKLFD